ncbi:MAG TPA: nucleotidyltransferase domain-containing protein [Candidatus Limnocylindria bacterium]|nr:nucleotidyltransferase domain-containing protein [Candidatus Limnocylindria bacterium]
MTTRQRDLYHRALVAVAAAPRPGATLREVAAALEAYDSSAQQALFRLVDDGVVARADGRYRLKPSRRSALELERSQYELDTERLLRIATRINRAVQVATFDPGRQTLHVILDPTADPAAVRQLRDTVARLEGVRLQEHPELLTLGTTVEDLDARRALRARLARGRPMKGDLDEVLRDREPGDPERGKPLGRIHPDLTPPSRRAKQRLARTYGLDEISLFGSATRRDFRRDSDVDALVHFRRGVAPTLGSYGALAQDLSRLMGRKVDVVDAASVEPAFIPTIERDRVRLYGRSHALVPRASPGVRDPGDRRPGTARARLGR